ncbi:hypothetical protein ACFVFJ_48500, partial [Streptomyces sp. NPDC057717]
MKRIAFRPGADPAQLGQAIGGFLGSVAAERQASWVHEVRKLIDNLPDGTFTDESVNAAHRALNVHDKDRPVMAVPGAVYVSSSRVTNGPGQGFINRDIPDIVVINGEPFVPVYTAVFGDVLASKKPQFKDFGQDEHSVIQVHTGSPDETEAVLWVSIGQPLRQIKWVEKYKADSAPEPMIRSILVPLRTANIISRGAVAEHGSGKSSMDINVDKHFASNQFGIKDPESLELLRQTALPGSLRTYTDGITEGRPRSWGDVRPTSELRDRLGVPNETMPGYRVFTEGIDFLRHTKYESTARKLREVVAAHYKNPKLHERGDKHQSKADVERFFHKHAPVHLKNFNATVKAEKVAAVDRFVRDYVSPWATQARIAQSFHHEYEEFLNSSPSERPVDYRLTDEQPTLRGQRRTVAQQIAEDHRQYMSVRFGIRKGFEDIGGPMLEAFRQGMRPEVRRVLQDLRNNRKDILADYQFKIGESSTLPAGNDKYLRYATEMHDRITNALGGQKPNGGLADVLHVLSRIQSAGKPQSAPHRPPSAGRPPQHGGLSVAQHAESLDGRVVRVPVTEADVAGGGVGEVQPGHPWAGAGRAMTVSANDVVSSQGVRVAGRPVTSGAFGVAGSAGRARDDRQWVYTLDGRVVPLERLRGLALTDENGTLVGRASQTTRDMALRTGRYAPMVNSTNYWDYDKDNDSLGHKWDVPWRPGNASFFVGHGTETRVTLALHDDTTVRVTGKELARVLQHWQDLGPQNRSIVLYSCESGLPPQHGGLSVAQHVANLTGRLVHAPTTEVGTAKDNAGRFQPILHKDADGNLGTWKVFTPEPAGTTLDDLARAAGHHQGPGPADLRARTRTLQLVRTLRGTLGTQVEDTPTYPTLLHGLAAVDTLRWNGEAGRPATSYTDGRMTPDLLSRITRDLLGLPASMPLDPAHYTAILSTADKARTTNPATPLPHLRVTAPTLPHQTRATPPATTTPSHTTVTETGVDRTPQPTRPTTQPQRSVRPLPPATNPTKKVHFADDPETEPTGTPSPGTAAEPPTKPDPVAKDPFIKIEDKLEVADARAQVTKAIDAWADADRSYWEKRRAVSELLDRLHSLDRDRTTAERELSQAVSGGRTPGSDDVNRGGATDVVSSAGESTEDEAGRRRLSELTEELQGVQGALRTTVFAMNADLRRAEAEAAEFHRVRAEADRLTRWHRLPAEPHAPDEPERRAGLLEPAPPVYRPLPALSTDRPLPALSTDRPLPALPTDRPLPALPTESDPEQVRSYTETTAEQDSEEPDTLTSPSGETYTLRDVPADGDAFYHALAEGLHQFDPALLSDQVPVTDLTTRRDIVAGLRELLATRLSHPDNAGLLDTEGDFSANELAAAGVAFDENTPERRELDDSGRLPLHARLAEQLRTGLAATQLRRSGDAVDGGGRDHSAADLLPALAARTFGVQVTVVRDNGSFQDFPPTAEVTPDGLPRVVLHLKDRHYRLAVPEGAPARPPLPDLRPATTSAPPGINDAAPDGQSRYPAYAGTPWSTAATDVWQYRSTAGRSTLTSEEVEAVRRLLPPAIRGGFGADSALVEMSGSVRAFQPMVMSLIEQAIGDRGLAPLTAEQKHRLHRSLAADFSLQGIKAQGNRLLSSLGLRRRVLLPNGVWATVVVKATYDPELPTGTGLREDRSVGIIPLNTHSVDDAQSASRTLSLATGLAARFSLSSVTGGRLGDVGIGGRYTHTRTAAESLDTSEFMAALPGTPVIDGPSRWFDFQAELQAHVTLDAPVTARIPAQAPGEGGRSVLRKSWRPAPATRAEAMPVGITFWLPEQLIHERGPLPKPEIQPDAGLGALGGNAGRERLRVDDLLFSPLVPPLVAEQLNAMLGAVTGIRPEDQRALVARFTDPTNLLTYLQRGTGNGSWQTEVLEKEHRWADAHLVVRLGIEVRKSVAPFEGEVRSGRLALIEPTQAITSGRQHSAGHTGSANVSLGVNLGTAHGETLGAGGSYGAGHSSGTAAQHKMIKGYLESTGTGGYQHRSADVVYTLEVEHWRDTLFGTVRTGQLSNLRRIKVPGGLEFLRPVQEENTAEDLPIHVPQRIPARQVMALGAARALAFQEDTTARPAGHNPLIDAVVTAVGIPQPGPATGHMLPLAAERNLRQSLHQLLSPTALQGAIHRLVTTGLRISPLGPGGPVLLLKGEPAGDFTYTEARSTLSVATLTSSFTWAQESQGRSLHNWSVTLGASGGTTPANGTVSEADHNVGYAWSGGRNQSSSILGGHSDFDMITFQPGARLYEGSLRVSVTVLPTGKVIDPARHQKVATIDLVHQISVPDALLALPHMRHPRPAPVVSRVNSQQQDAILPDRAFAVTPETVQARHIIPREVADFAVGELYEGVRRQLAAASDLPALRSLLLTWGTTAEAAFADVMALAPQTFFAETLTQNGYTSPVLLRPGVATETHGQVTLQARLFDAKPLGYVTVSHSIDSNDRARLSTGWGASKATGFTLGAGAGETVNATQSPSQSAGLPSRTVSDSSQSRATNHSLVGLGDQRERPEQQYLVVRASALYTVTLKSVNERGALRHGAEEKSFTYRLDDTVELLIHPDEVKRRPELHITPPGTLPTIQEEPENNTSQQEPEEQATEPSLSDVDSQGRSSLSDRVFGVLRGGSGVEGSGSGGVSRAEGEVSDEVSGLPVGVSGLVPVRGLPVGFALGGRFGVGGRIANREVDVVGHVDAALVEAVRQGGHPEEIRGLAWERMGAARGRVGYQQWVAWLAQGGDEVAVRSGDGRGYVVRVELVLPAPGRGGLFEVSGTQGEALLGEGEEWGAAWDPEADQRYSSSRTRSVNWSGSLAASHAVAPLNFMTVSTGPSVGASFGRGRSRTHLSVDAGRRTMPKGGGVWFIHPDARVEVSVRPEVIDQSEAAVVSRPVSVTVGFPSSMVPPRGTDEGAVAGGPVRGEVVLARLTTPGPELQRRRDDLMWEHITSPEAIGGLEDLQQKLVRRLGGRLLPGSDAHLRLRQELGEAKVLRAFTQLAGLGMATAEVPLEDGHWVAVGLQMRLRSVTRVDGGDIQDSTTWSQQRHLDLAGESASRGLGGSLGVPVSVGFSVDDGNYGLNVTALRVSGALDRSRSVEVDHGPFLWQKLTTKGPTGAYELGVEFVAEVRSDLPEVAGEETADGTVYARVPTLDAQLFEAGLATLTDTASADTVDSAVPQPLVGPDGTPYELVETLGDRNGFWSTLAVAFHPDRHRDPVGLVQGGELPAATTLAPNSRFSHDELMRAGVTLDATQSERFRRDGGRLPEGLRLSPRQNQALLRTQLHTARRWDDTTGHVAAQLAADVYRATLTVVKEDGRARTYTAANAVDGRAATLYQRGAEYLLARPEPRADRNAPAPAPVDDNEIDYTLAEDFPHTVVDYPEGGWAQEDPAPSAEFVPPDPSARPELATYPWYMDHGALGDTEVGHVPEWSEQRAELWAAVVASHIQDRRVRRAVLPVLQEILASSDPAQWNKALAKGRMVVVGKRLVWLRPVLANVRPLGQTALADGTGAVARSAPGTGMAPAKVPVPNGWVPEGDREVRVGTRSTTRTGSRTTTSGASAAVLTAVDLGLAHVSAVYFVPRVSVTASTAENRNVERTVKTSHRTHTEWKDFSAADTGIRFRVFVDGEEWENEVVVERDLGAVFPPALPADVPPVGALEGGTAEGQNGEGQNAEGQVPTVQRLVRTPQYLNALDTVPLITGLHQQLLAAALPAVTVRDVMTQLEPWLVEKGLRQQARWVLTSGLPTGPIEASIPGRRKPFRASFTIRAGIDSLQFLGLSEPRINRGLEGVATNSSSAVDGSSRTAVTGGYAMGGLSDTSGGAAVAGRGAEISITGHSSRTAGYSLSSTATRHTEFKSSKPQVTYAAGLGMTVSVTSPEHNIGEVNRTAQAELGTMWRGRPQAADFEQRVLGAVHTLAFSPPATPVEASRPVPLPGPVETQPHVRALLRESGTRLVRNHERPARLDQKLPAPHRREPLELASRKGVGYSSTLVLPGAELVQDQFLAALKDDVARRGDKVSDWTTVEREVSSVFGRPAMEQDLGRVIAGYRKTVWVGNRPYRLSVRAHLLERLPGDMSTGMEVDTVVGAGGGVSGHRGTRWGVRGNFGGGLRVKIHDLLSMRIGGFGGFAEYSRGKDTSFSGGNKSSRRSKPKVGTDEHVYNIVYEQKLTPLKPRSDRKEVLRKPQPHGSTESWWVNRPGDVVAQVVVPHAFVPKTPVTAEQAVKVGTAKREDSWPAQGQDLDFTRGGTSGVVPDFLPAPELTKLAATLYAQLNGLPTGWAENPELWPDEIHALADPAALGSAFNDMVGRFGYEGELQQRKGFNQGFRLRLRSYAPEDLGETAAPVQIVDTKEANTGQGAVKGTTVEVGAGGTLGGYITAAGAQPDPNPEEGRQKSSVGGSGGHLYLQGLGWVSKGWSNALRKEPGQVSKNKTTYKTSPRKVASLPVFEFTAIRWKGNKTEEQTGYLGVVDGLQLLVPQRVLPDVMPRPADEQAEPEGSRKPPAKAERDGQPPAPADSKGKGKENGKGKETAPAPAGEQQAPQARLDRDYLTSDIVGGIGRVERLRADQVMDAITTRLQAHGVLPAGPLTDSPRPALLNRTLHQLFSSGALENQMPLLMGTGVWAWLPRPGFLGATSYVWVRVLAEELKPAHEHRPRPDAKLNVSATATMNTRRDKGKFGSWGGELHGRAGAFHASGRDGFEVNAGYRQTRSRTESQSNVQAEIYEADPQDVLEEFNHRAVFRVEVGGTTELPRVLDLPVTGVRHTLLGVAHHGFDSRERIAKVLNEHRAWTWFEGDGRAEGEVRILVPSQLTGPTGGQPVSPISRVYGEDPRWAELQPVPELPAELLYRLHPLAVPAAAAVERWAAVAASAAKREPDLQAAEAWKAQGIDFTTTEGPSYAHFTGTGMLRANIAQLLQHTYDVPVNGRQVPVGFRLDNARVVGPPQGLEHDAARYFKDEPSTTYSEAESSGWSAGAGPRTVGDGAGPTMLYGDALVSGGVSRSDGYAYRDSSNDENSRTGKVKRPYRYYQFDLTVVFQGLRRTLEVKAPRGLFAMLPLGADGKLLGGLETVLPDLFGPVLPEQIGQHRDKDLPALPTPMPESDAVASAATGLEGTPTLDISSARSVRGDAGVPGPSAASALTSAARAAEEVRRRTE